ncbi:Peptidase family C25 [Thermoplasmatales archaeon SCGC AB-539-C06]|nr:Peptidase family C25 [Thermoplasmatales archaeon SCGC AB-539-C06]
MHIIYYGDNDMKNLIPVAIIGILILSGIGASALHKTDDVNQKTMTVAFSQPVIKEKDQYVIVEIDGANSVSMGVNEPLLPAYVHTFTFPFGTKIEGVECTPSDIQQQYLSKKIIPSTEPVLAGQQAVQEKKSVSYAENSYPNTWYEYDVGCGLDNNERCVFVKVQVFPIRYYPSEDLLKVVGNFQINVEYEEPNQQTMTFDDERDLIILAPSEFSSMLNALVAHKIGRGISSKLITLDEIYDSSYFPVNGRDNQEKIKYFIKSAIESWDIKNVLLVGGSEKFPTRQTHVFVDYNPSDPDNEVFVSDLYYADIYDEVFEFCSWDSNENDLFGEYDWDGLYDDVDFYPDVHLGRLACIDSNEVTTCVNKIVAYETNEAYAQNWFTNLVVIGGDTSPNDAEDVDEGEYVNQAIIDIMDGFIPTKCWASEGTLGTITPVNTALNGGAGFVDFSGHGNTKLWLLILIIIQMHGFQSAIIKIHMFLH